MGQGVCVCVFMCVNLSLWPLLMASSWPFLLWQIYLCPRKANICAHTHTHTHTHTNPTHRRGAQSSDHTHAPTTTTARACGPSRDETHRESADRVSAQLSLSPLQC